MSISPIEAQSSNSSSSSSSLSVNPNSQHGHEAPISPMSQIHSLHISDNNSDFDTPNNSGTFVSAESHSQQVRKKKSHVTSGNHLLNFHYDPINQPGRARPSQQPPPPNRRHNRKLKPYNKDLFLQANYKFVVLDSADYSPESVDPDKMLQWDHIICLRYSSPTAVVCPICLDHPLCAQITSCGHIFCFPCILRYLLMGKEDAKGESWKKCPLCFVMISPKDLYTVFIESVGEFSVGDRLDFSLLTRNKDSNSISRNNKQCSAVESYDPFSKFTFTSDVDLSVREAMADLDGWIAKADSGLVDDLEKLPYVCAAMEHLEQRKKYWDQHRASDTEKSKVQTLPREFNCPVNLDLHTDCSDQSAESLESRDNVLSSSYEEIKGVQGSPKENVEEKENESYKFYQAADGQHIILHPLNMKCLLNHFGSHSLLPERISGKILQLEAVTQSEAIRRRFRYLSHFSLTTTFQLCEIDLSDSLPPDALLPFMDEIKKRDKQRKQVARKERKDKIKAEAAMDCTVPIFSNVQQSYYGESPVFSMDDFEALGSSNSSTTTTTSSPPVVGERKLLFSSVTRLGYAAGHDSPGLKIEENNSRNDNQAISESSVATGSRNSGAVSFANVISRAQVVEPKAAGDLGKRGKKQSRILLSNSGGRRY